MSKVIKGAKRRLAVTLDPRVSQALEDFARVSGTSQSAFIGSMMLEALPVIQSLTKAFTLAKQSPKEALTIMQDEMLRTQIKTAQASLELEEKPSKKLRPYRQRDGSE